MAAGPAQRILTVPPELDAVPPVVPTANEWVALPDVDPTDGSVRTVNVLHEGTAGLVELGGRPLVAPDVLVDGRRPGPDAWRLELLADFVPRLTARVGDVALRLTICCPPDHKGFVQVLEATNHGTETVEVVLGLGGEVADVALRVFSGRRVEGPHRCRWDPWTASLTWEASTGLPLAALAVRAADGGAPTIHRGAHETRADDPGDGPDDGPHPTGAGHDPGRRPAAGPEDAIAPNGSVAWPLPTRWSHRRAARLDAGEADELVLCWGVGREADGAGLAAVDLARHGAARLIDATEDHLRARHGPPLEGRPGLERLRNRNRLFCLHFAAGRAIDTEALALVTSRSPRYYVSAAHWTRDSLLWAFPAVLAVDHELAAEWLRAAFARYTRNAGRHALYLDGGLLYPGFELDQVCAFHLALDAHLDATGDEALLAEPEVRTGLARVDAALAGARDDDSGLLRTFLLPTDDPAPLPLVTYDNALAVAALRAAARTRDRVGDPEGAHAARTSAKRLLEALLAHAVVDGPFGPMLCGATDGRGAHVVFDEPPGSLELLAHYGVLAADDPLLLATRSWIHSSHNPYGPGAGRYAAPSCDHAHHPWLLAVGNALLAGETGWLERLPELTLDGGLACESFDEHTGQPRTGLGFATCAGWLAHAIDVATRTPGPTAQETP